MNETVVLLNKYFIGDLLLLFAKETNTTMVAATPLKNKTI